MALHKAVELLRICLDVLCLAPAKWHVCSNELCVLSRKIFSKKL